ncbi:MAG: serine/threonine-protein kinase, partial [Chloroflexota bacterium]
EALFHAHQRGVVHRDVKPGNILIAADGRARLVDFGIARLLDEAAERLTMTGTVMGTLRYMAPEQLAGGEVGPRTDLWALGAVLYEMLVGRPPFTAANPVALADEQRTAVPHVGGLDPGLASIAAAALAIEPEDRPRHVGAVAAALRGWLANGSVDAALLAPVAAVSPDADTAAVPVIPAAQPPPGPPVRPTPGRRMAAPAWPLLLALMAAVLVIGWLAFNAARGAVPGSGSSGAATATATATASASPAPTVSPVPTAVPTIDIGSLPKPVRDQVRKYLDACGGDAPLPDNLASMNKKAAENFFGPLIETCGGA